MLVLDVCSKQGRCNLAGRASGSTTSSWTEMTVKTCSGAQLEGVLLAGYTKQGCLSHSAGQPHGTSPDPPNCSPISWVPGAAHLFLKGCIWVTSSFLRIFFYFPTDQSLYLNQTKVLIVFKTKMYGMKRNSLCNVDTQLDKAVFYLFPHHFLISSFLSGSHQCSEQFLACKSSLRCAFLTFKFLSSARSTHWAQSLLWD